MLGDFVMNIVSGIASLLEMIPQSIFMTNYATAYIPDVLSVFAVAGISICVVFHIIGR